MAEITSKVKLSYLKNGAWKSFSSKIQSSIDGLKIQTSNSAYYLQYRTWNQGKTAFYPYVKSTVNDYAGMDGRPVQLLQIQALKSDGTQLDSGIVVMFRTYTDGKWLPWVSNADPKWMESVQKKYKLGGTLDTSGAYAGLSGKNAAGVEIRVFEEGPLGNFEGGEVKAGFSYMADSESNWTEFSSAALAPYMDGIKIQTPTNKGYYLTYKTWNEGKENYYPAVKSTVNDYAGVPGRHIQRLAISAYKNDGTVLTSGVIVMYRAFVDGRWLPWVSNADAQWMRSIKEKHELDGTLDTSSGYAGISGKNLGGVEIRIFEDDAPNAGSDRFEGDEIPLELGYIANNNTWHSFTKSVKASPMDGIKIQTSASDFYLAYKTWNEGKENYYPEVKSTENDYAGMAGRPIQRVSISACSADGTRLDSGVVVMYRAFVDGRWLPWVSNAGAEHMKNVQSRFNLDGTLDTISNYAGISGKNIAGLEIRAFKGELDEGIQDLPGTESTPAMSYMYSNIWQSFPGSILHDPIEGVKIQTASSKPYYFTYKTWNEGKTWYYPAVKSTEDDYAGMSGGPIQRLYILVFRNVGTALDSGVVVMYRVYVEGRWLPWVSNATREWMQSVQDKYQLDGTLDSTGTYAGISGKNISGLEIRVYEENQITDTPITPTGKHKIIDVDFITQIGTYPTGCESVTAVMALHHNGINISVKNFINHYLDMQPYPFDPFETFGGDPFSNNGWGCYAPVIKKALDKALVGLPYYAEELSGVSLQKLCTDYIDKNIPVILWATMGMRASKTITWTYNGRRIEWVQPEHCLLLVGYDEKHYIFNDPQKSRPLTYYTKESVEKAYKAQFSQAVVILRKKEEPEEPEKPIIPVYKYGAVKNPVTGEIYPIRYNKGTVIDLPYELEDNPEEAKPTRLTITSFDWVTFFAGLDFDDSLVGKDYPGISSILTLFAGCLSSANQSIENVYIDVSYWIHPPTGKRQADVSCGSTSYDGFFDTWISYGVPGSLWNYQRNINPANGEGDWLAWRTSIDNTGRKQFEEYTGLKHQLGYTYDYLLTFAPERKIDRHFSKIILGKDGNIYEIPALRSGEKFELLVLKEIPVVGITYEEVARIDVTSEITDRIYKVSDERAALFNILKP